MLQVASLQGLQSVTGSSFQSPAATTGQDQAQVQFQQLSQGIAEALQEPFTSAATPLLRGVVPACMVGNTKTQHQQITEAAESAPAAHGTMEKQSSSPGDIPVPGGLGQPEQNQGSQQDLNRQPASASEQPTTWLAWEHQLHSEEPGPACSQLADEYMHPHTQWVLKQPLANYVLDPQPVVLKHIKQTASGGLVTGSAAASGSPSGDALGPTGDAEADTATQQGSPDAQTPGPPDSFPSAADMQPGLHTVPSRGQLSRLAHEDSSQPGQLQLGAQQRAVNGLLHEQATPTLSGFSASQPALPDMPAESEPFTPAISAASHQLLGRQNSSAVAGPAKSSSRLLGRQRNSINYNLLAGNRKTDAKGGSGVHKGSRKGLNKNSPVPQAEVRKDQAALAVSAAIAEGEAGAVTTHFHFSV